MHFLTLTVCRRVFMICTTLYLPAAKLAETHRVNAFSDSMSITFAFLLSSFLLVLLSFHSRMDTWTEILIELFS